MIGKGWTDLFEREVLHGVWSMGSWTLRVCHRHERGSKKILRGLRSDPKDIFNFELTAYNGCGIESCIEILTVVIYLFLEFTFRPAPTCILPPALPLSPVKMPGR